MEPIRIVLVDDHPIVRSAIRDLLAKAADIQVVGECATGEEVFALIKDTSPDVLLLDMELPGIKGFEVARRLDQMGSPVKVLALSAHNDPDYIHEILECGASGYLVKDETPETILEAIRGVARGEKGWVSRSVAAKVAQWIRGEISEKVRLTGRERDVLRCLVAGGTNENIAAALGMSERTVEKHLYSIFTKLDVESRVEAAVYAVRERLV